MFYLAHLNLVSFYSFTACSDPGIIWIEKSDNDDQGKVEDVERAMNKLECGICHIDRPRTASHCFECGMCVDKLDHHCPVSITHFYIELLFYCALIHSGQESVSARKQSIHSTHF